MLENAEVVQPGGSCVACSREMGAFLRWEEGACSMGLWEAQRSRIVRMGWPETGGEVRGRSASLGRVGRWG